LLGIADNYCSRDVLSDMKKMDKNQIVNIDSNNGDPQLCATFACDIYKHLRASEVITLNQNVIFLALCVCKFSESVYHLYARLRSDLMLITWREFRKM